MYSCIQSIKKWTVLALIAGSIGNLYPSQAKADPFNEKFLGSSISRLLELNSKSEEISRNLATQTAKRDRMQRDMEALTKRNGELQGYFGNFFSKLYYQFTLGKEKYDAAVLEFEKMPAALADKKNQLDSQDRLIVQTRELQAEARAHLKDASTGFMKTMTRSTSWLPTLRPSARRKLSRSAVARVQMTENYLRKIDESRRTQLLSVLKTHALVTDSATPQGASKLKAFEQARVNLAVNRLSDAFPAKTSWTESIQRSLVSAASHPVVAKAANYAVATAGPKLVSYATGIPEELVVMGAERGHEFVERGKVAAQAAADWWNTPAQGSEKGPKKSDKKSRTLASAEVKGAPKQASFKGESALVIAQDGLRQKGGTEAKDQRPFWKRF